MAYVIGKNNQEFDGERLKQSVQATARANRVPDGQAANFAENIVQKVERWLTGKTEITARELRLQTVAVMAEYDPETAYLYENENKLF